MLQRIKSALGWEVNRPEEDVPVRHLRQEIESLKEQQRELEQELNETRVRAGFKNIQRDRNIRWLYERTSAIKDVKQQLQDVAIEEKVDASSLKEQLQALRTDTADTGHVQTQLQDLHTYIDRRQDAIREDITVIDTAIHDTIEELRYDLINAFHKELLALETMLSYEIDAIEAKDRWARDDLENRVTALHDTVQNDLSELEADTVALLKANTEQLEEQLDSHTAQLSAIQNVLHDHLNIQIDELQEELEHQQRILSAADPENFEDIQENQAAIQELTENLRSVQDRIDEQQDRVKDARQRLEEELDDAITRLTDEEVAPLHDRVQEIRDALDHEISTLEDTVQEEVEELTRQYTAQKLGHDRRLSTLEDRLDQEVAATETLQSSRFTEQENEISTLHNDIDTALNMLNEMDADLSTVQDQITDLTDAEDVDTLKEAVDTMKERITAVDEAAADTQTVEQLQEYVGRVRERIGAVADTKADKQDVNQHLDRIEETITGLDENLKEAQTLLDERLTDLEQTAADADTVDDLTEQLDALEDAAARKAQVREALDSVHDELTALRDGAVDQEDLEFVEKRVQKLREQVGEQNLRREFKKRLQRLERLEHRAEETIAEQESFKHISRTEFEELHKDVRELYRYVNELSRRNQSAPAQEAPDDPESQNTFL